MDQTVESAIYGNRVVATLTNWKQQSNKEFTSHANVIGKDGTPFYKGEDGRLHQRLDGKNMKFAKVVIAKNSEFLATRVAKESEFCVPVEVAEELVK